MSYFSPLVAIVATVLLIYLLLSSKAARNIQDIPNERSLHTEPVPRVGGVALILGMLSGWVIMFDALPWGVVLPLVLLFLLSMLDDMRGLSVRYRLLVHICAAVMLVSGTGLFSQNLFYGILLLLLIVWAINLYNFMDGSDGLAGGMALIGFSMYGIAAIAGNYIPFAMLNFSIAAASLGFLYFNFFPARIFMGDAGSIPLGFLAAAMGIWGWQIALWPAWFPLMVFSPFVLDASVTLVKRGLRKEKIWQAHREHYYQRLVQLGFGHRNTALLEYGLMASVGASALLARQYSEISVAILLMWAVVYILLMSLLEYHWKNRKNA